jgi:hypothetical protein
MLTNNERPKGDNTADGLRRAVTTSDLEKRRLTLARFASVVVGGRRDFTAGADGPVQRPE